MAAQRMLSLPALDPVLKQAGADEGVTGVFRAWEGLEAAGLLRREEGPVTVLTVSDTVWDLSIVRGGEDPLSQDPVFQRQVVASQVVLARLDQSQAGVVKTVGGRSLVISREAGRLTVNDLPVIKIVSAANNEIWMLEKLLFIRPEDIELGVGRVRGDVK